MISIEKISSGTRIIIFIIFLDQILPSLLYNEYNNNYIFFSNKNFFIYVFFLIIAMSFTLYDQVFPCKKKYIISDYSDYKHNFMWIKFSFVIFLIIFQIILGIKEINLNNWRYKEAALSDDLNFYIFTFPLLLKIIPIIIFYELFFFKKIELDNKLNNFINIILIISGFFYIDGNASLLLYIFCLPFFIKKLNYLLFKLHIRTLIFVFSPIFIVILFFFNQIYAFGESIKRDIPYNIVENEISLHSPYENISNLLTNRYSVHYVSTMVSLNVHENEITLENIFIPLKSLVYRYNSIFQLNTDRPLYNSISHLNYYKITPETSWRNREGSSPGIIASFQYIFGFPLSFVISFLYFLLLKSCINMLLQKTNLSLSIIGEYYLIQFLLPLIESPLDFLNIIDDNIIFIINVFILWYFFLRRKRNARVAYPLKSDPP